MRPTDCQKYSACDASKLRRSCDSFNHWLDFKEKRVNHNSKMSESKRYMTTAELKVVSGIEYFFPL
jgi:hypothetical protein